MTETPTEILSAFCDGRVVDPKALASALVDPHARAALVDFAGLRAAIAPAAPLPASLEHLRPPPTRANRRLSTRPVVPAAAAIVLFLLAAAYLWPPDWWTRSRPIDSPPSPTRVMRYEPGVDWNPEDMR